MQRYSSEKLRLRAAAPLFEEPRKKKKGGDLGRYSLDSKFQPSKRGINCCWEWTVGVGGSLEAPLTSKEHPGESQFRLSGRGKTGGNLKLTHAQKEKNRELISQGSFPEISLMQVSKKEECKMPRGRVEIIARPTAARCAGQKVRRSEKKAGVAQMV